jgi:CBS domain-containing protein
MNLGEQFRSEVATAAPGDPIRAVVEIMRTQNVGAVVITKDRRVVGIVTDRDVALALGSSRVTPQESVESIMTRKVRTIWEDEGLFNATQYFLSHKVRRLPIVNHDDELVGLVAFDDVLALLSRELFNISKAVGPALPPEESLLTQERMLPKR